MKASYSKQFLRQYTKLPPKIRQKTDERIMLWQSNPLNSQLRNHQLKGKYKQYRSIDITGDVRALYLQNENEAIFDAVGTHSQLYG
jgi:addiction module RelE/StbE family toxin